MRLLGEELRAHKAALGRLVSIEVGKIASEGAGEVQEMIDICDFAVGLSRQLHGLTIASERPDHRMMETWHPLGVVGVISAFNFPVAVWAWNAALALVCGDSVVWKPSEKAPLSALATQSLFERARRRFLAEGGGAPEGLSTLLIGGRDIGEILVDHRDVALVSATGSTAMGRKVGPRLAARFARALLELGGNNAAIVCPSADLDLTVRGVAFAAMGTAGQRCTSLRRLFAHEDVYDALIARLKRAYRSVPVGDPLAAGTLVGPLIDQAAFEAMGAALEAAKAAGGVVTGGERVECGGPGAAYVRPALVEMPAQVGPALRETFAPILYVMKYRDLGEAIALPERRPAGPFVVDLHQRSARGRAVRVGARLRLRHRQCEHRSFGRRDRRRLRRREGDRRRARIRLRRLEGLYAPRHQHDQFRPDPAARAGGDVRRRLSEARFRRRRYDAIQ